MRELYGDRHRVVICNFPRNTAVRPGMGTNIHTVMSWRHGDRSFVNKCHWYVDIQLTRPSQTLLSALMSLGGLVGPASRIPLTYQSADGRVSDGTARVVLTNNITPSFNLLGKPSREHIIHFVGCGEPPANLIDDVVEREYTMSASWAYKEIDRHGNVRFPMEF
jgi:hypothetical protein